MAQVLMLTDSAGDALPGLELLNHRVRTLPAESASIARAPDADLVLLDARTNLAQARSLCQVVHTTLSLPVIVVVSEAGLATLNDTWKIDDFLLATASPGEVEARLRLAAIDLNDEPTAGEIRAGGIVIDEPTYTASIHGRLLNLTYKEFELLKHLARNPGQVFTREQMLHDVWGYDYFGGTRTVDVHVRRLRSKLGPEHESLIGTVRNVGYRLMTEAALRHADAQPSEDAESAAQP